jgi:alkylation response protein AidB-like acyl-CoA dehydrogenase
MQDVAGGGTQMVMTSNTTTPTGTILERVEALRDVIREGGDEAQQLRRLPQHTVDALIDAGLFRATLPKALGGEDLSSMQTVEMIEAVSAIDASVGWNLMLGSEINAMAAGGMDPVLAKEVYLDNPRVVMCGGGGPGTQPSYAKRDPDGDGYRVWGQSTFISGCHNATWFFQAAPLLDDAGDVAKDANGAPIVKMWFLHRDQWEIIDTWDVAALRGSGSHDVRVVGGHVPEKFADVGLVTFPAHYDNPVFRMPVPLRLSYNKAAVSLGIAKGVLTEFDNLARTKVPMLSTTTLKDRPIAQYRYGHAMAVYRSARAYLMEAMTEIEDELHAGAPWPGAATTQNARLACTYAANACMELVDSVTNAAGTSAIYMANPLERKLRDAHGAATHRWTSHQLFTDLGRIFLGGDPGPEFDGSNSQSPRPS